MHSDEFLNKFFTLHSVDCEEEMLKIVNGIVSRDFDNDTDILPPFRFHMFSNKNGLSGMLVRIHHVIGDGMSMVGAMTQLFTEEDDTPVKLDFIPGKGSGDGVDKKKHNSMLHLISIGIKFAFSLLEALLITVSAYDSDILFSSQKKTELVMAKPGKSKIIYFPTIKLDVVKAIKNKAKVTLNDVMMSLTSGVIHRYCEYRKDPLLTQTHKKTLQNRALVPFAFPRKPKEIMDPHVGMRNNWAFLSIQMPIVMSGNGKGDDACISRLKECHKTTVALKNSPMALATLWIQNNVLPCLPKFFQQKAALDLFQRHTMVFSNVPGPSRSIRLCGERVVGLQAIFANLLPQIIMLSYGGAIFANLVVDEEIVTDANIIEELYLLELLDLCKAYDIELPGHAKITTTKDLLSPLGTSASHKIGTIDQEVIVPHSIATLKKIHHQ